MGGLQDMLRRGQPHHRSIDPSSKATKQKKRQPYSTTTTKKRRRRRRRREEHPLLCEKRYSLVSNAGESVCSVSVRVRGRLPIIQHHAIKRAMRMSGWLLLIARAARHNTTEGPYNGVKGSNTTTGYSIQHSEEIAKCVRFWMVYGQSISQQSVQQVGRRGRKKTRGRKNGGRWVIRVGLNMSEVELR